MLHSFELKTAKLILSLARQQFGNALEAPIGLLLLVSGGRDSMTLLNVIAKIARSQYLVRHRCRLRAAVLHFNHEQRGAESDGDEAFVRETCAELGLPFFVKNWSQRWQEQETSGGGRRRGFQAEARHWRYYVAEKLQEELKREWGACEVWVVTAHHARDHAESLLLHVIRGSGLAGLVGVREFDKERLLFRPFADVAYRELVDYSAEAEVGFRTDSSNESDDYDRNYLRRHLLPVIEHLNPSYELGFRRLSRAANEAIEAIKIPSAGARKCLRLEEETSASQVAAFARSVSSELSSHLTETVIQNILSHAFGKSGEYFRSNNASVNIPLKGGWRAVLRFGCLEFWKDGCSDAENAKQFE